MPRLSPRLRGIALLVALILAVATLLSLCIVNTLIVSDATSQEFSQEVIPTQAPDAFEGYPLQKVCDNATPVPLPPMVPHQTQSVSLQTGEFLVVWGYSPNLPDGGLVCMHANPAISGDSQILFYDGFVVIQSNKHESLTIGIYGTRTGSQIVRTNAAVCSIIGHATSSKVRPMNVSYYYVDNTFEQC